MKYHIEEESVVFNYPTRREASQGNIFIGKIIHNNKERYKYHLKLEDLERHMFVCGITGSGKSNFVQHFLINFQKTYNIPFLLAEFKGEYNYLKQSIPDMLILKVGENFTINIFDPEGTDPEIHAERVFQIFKSGGAFENIEYSAQMERVFVDILQEVCKNPHKRNWEGFKTESRRYLSQVKNKDYMIKQSIMAVQNRIRRYSLGSLKKIFIKKSGVSIRQLFDLNVLLDLSSIIKLGGEKEDALFFLNMILKYLWDRNLESGSKNYQTIRHMTIIEDAQYFASDSLNEGNRLTSYIEDIALLLRGTGECLISLATRPNISEEILANCGVFITFQNHLRKDFVQEVLNMEEKEKRFLSMLKTGQCVIRVNSIGKSFSLKIPLLMRKWYSNEQIEKDNQKILDKKGIANEKERDNKNQCLKESKSFEEKKIYQDKPDHKEEETNAKYCEICGNLIAEPSEDCIICKKSQENNSLSDFEEFLDLFENKQS